MDKESPSFHIIGFLFRLYCAFGTTSGPEFVPHGAPRVRRIGAKIRSAILSHHEPRSLSVDSHIDYAFVIDRRFDRVRVAAFVESQGKVIGIEGSLRFIEAKIGERIGAPLML